VVVDEDGNVVGYTGNALLDARINMRDRRRDRSPGKVQKVDNDRRTPRGLLARPRFSRISSSAHSSWTKVGPGISEATSQLEGDPSQIGLA